MPANYHYLSVMSDIGTENTKAPLMAWLSFILAAIGTIIGIVLLEVSLATKGFFAMGYVFTISSCFTLAKVIRDKHQAEKLIAKIEKAKTEKLITKYGIEQE
jgi:hypothetical protein